MMEDNEDNKGDTFNISGGQVGAMGHGAHAHDMTFNQVWNQASQTIDLPALAGELDALRKALRQEATEPEHDVAVANVAMAQKAAKENDGPKAMEYLSTAGKWALDIAAKIGVPIAIEALKSAMRP